MDARCPLCTSVFKTERTGVQFCPNCGQQVNVADVTGAAPPPPLSSVGGPGPNFGGGAPPPQSFPPPGRGETPWERRGEIGFVAAFIETWKASMFDPTNFFAKVRPNGGIWDALLYAWIVNIIAQLLNLPVRLSGIDRQDKGDLSSLPPDMRVQFEKLFAFLEQFSSPGAVIGTTIGSILFYPLLLIIGSAILHLFCLMFGAAKNGFGATVRTVCYAASPLVFSIWVIAAIAGIYNLVLIIIGLSKVQDTTAGRAAGAALSPMFLICCCCCVGILISAMGAAASMK